MPVEKEFIRFNIDSVKDKKSNAEKRLLSIDK